MIDRGFVDDSLSRSATGGAIMVVRWPRGGRGAETVSSVSATARRFRHLDIVRVRSTCSDEAVRGFEAVVIDATLVDRNGTHCYSAWVYAANEPWCFHEDDLEPTGRVERRRDASRWVTQHGVEVDGGEGTPS